MFRQGGLPLELLVLTDVSRSLRDEERQAWQRLIRVIGHEINNSLAPIKSIAHSLERLVSRNPRAEDWESDMRGGLPVIGSRADSLGRFTAAYAQLARLPAPALKPVSIDALVPRAAGLERRMTVAVHAGPAVTVQADADQIEQLLINIIRNAVDATLPTGGGVLDRLGVGRRTPCASASTTRARGCRTRRTCSSRSSPPSPKDPASASC